MAIIKPFETPQGVSATYHKIIKAELLMVDQAVDITVAIYASAEARESGKTVLWHEYQRVPFSVLTQDPRDLLYPLLTMYGDSFLRGGTSDAEGSGAPGNFQIDLKPEALEPAQLDVPQMEQPIEQPESLRLAPYPVHLVE